MKKLISIVLAAAFMLALTPAAGAVNTTRSFRFTLTADKEIYSPGETVTAALTLARTDVSDAAFTLYSVQDYVKYDTSRLRLEAVDTSMSGFSYFTYEHEPDVVNFCRYTFQSAGVSVSNPLTIAVLTFTVLDNSGTAVFNNTRAEVATTAGNIYQSDAIDAEITVLGTARATKILSAQASGAAASLTLDNVTTPGWLVLAAAYSSDDRYISSKSALTTGKNTLSIPLAKAENAAYIRFIVLDRNTFSPIVSAFTLTTGGA